MWIVIGSSFIASLQAQSTPSEIPTTIGYQGTLHGHAGRLTGTYQMIFAIYDAANGGNILWGPETQIVEVLDGVFNVLLGSIIPIDSTLLTSSKSFLGITVESDAEMTPRQPLASVPFAIKAEHASHANNSENANKAEHANNSENANKAEHANNSENANKAEHANNSDYATNAEHANNSDHSEHANNSENANKAANADKATKADNADKATKADNADFATNAEHAATADHATVADRALSVDNPVIADGAPNLGKIATLHWYDVNKSGVQPSIDTGSNVPTALCFDGVNLWVSYKIISGPPQGFVIARNSSSFQPVYCSMPGSGLSIPGGNVPYPVLGGFVGPDPRGMAYDGLHIWSANYGDGTVTRVNTYSGTTSGRYVGAGPAGIAFDGEFIWVTLSGENKVAKLKANEPMPNVVGKYDVGNFPAGICCDGENIWVGNSGSGTVSKLSKDGAILGTYTVGSGTYSMCIDGSNIWVAHRDAASVTKLRASDGAILGTYTVGPDPSSICFDGSNIWVAIGSPARVSRIKCSDGTVLTYEISNFSTPQAVCFDGINICVAGYNGALRKF
jgi:hypothetical protein